MFLGVLSQPSLASAAVFCQISTSLPVLTVHYGDRMPSCVFITLNFLPNLLSISVSVVQVRLRVLLSTCPFVFHVFEDVVRLDLRTEKNTEFTITQNAEFENQSKRTAYLKNK